MILAALFSGGKDSTYSVYKSKKDGNSVKCLVTVAPASPESALLHHPNTAITKLQSESMGIPQIYVESHSGDTSSELDLIASAVQEAKKNYKIEGLIQGGILSEFQRKNFERICDESSIKLVSPVWHQDQRQYMRQLLQDGFEFVITSVSAGGLDESWLGKKIDSDSLGDLERLSERHGFNLSFEGGEAETLVTDCPIFSSPVRILRSRKIWDGYRGKFEIEDASIH